MLPYIAQKEPNRSYPFYVFCSFVVKQLRHNHKISWFSWNLLFQRLFCKTITVWRIDYELLNKIQGWIDVFSKIFRIQVNPFHSIGHSLSNFHAISWTVIARDILHSVTAALRAALFRLLTQKKKKKKNGPGLVLVRGSRPEMEPVRIFSTQPINFKIYAGWPANRSVSKRPGRPFFSQKIFVHCSMYLMKNF